ncbi:hypothetical protein HRG_004312 [Hirsutella rhossiliensis]|uniref:Uncharacterized protein n=1 Tax=Hirsutella rhossiliensis TaxID=111463 RepID=A0A9P8N0U9_9HYPO|nr:uncharacterized protein HRG_04312 [Hirsutella rhossiliensis]KAH0963884.1 hypothetical protein HRG_04312 [Hirsutella rhossiliensis]
MDPFESLSCELRLLVLESASTRDDMVRLSHASPALLQARLAFRATLDTYFRKKELSAIFPRDLLQDAMAIVLFPKKDILDEKRSKARVEKHMETWATKEFPDPSDEYSRLQRLYKQLKSQLEFDHLSATEKYRLLKTFLRFELYSKLFSAGIFKLAESGDQAQYTASSWSWGYLNKMENTSLAAYEREGFCCVAEYIHCLYAVLRAYAQGYLDYPDAYPKLSGASFDNHSTFWGNSIVPGIHNDHFSTRRFLGDRIYLGTLLGGFDCLDRLLGAEKIEAISFFL